MVEKIASRRAGQALLSIIGVLLVPLVLLGTLYVRQAMKEISFLGGEMKGVAIAELAYGVLLSDGHDVPSSLRTKIAEHEKDLPRAPLVPIDSLAETLSEPGETVTDVHDAHEGHESHPSLLRYFAGIGDSSNLILDAESMTFHLANAYITFLPHVVESHEVAVESVTSGSNYAKELLDSQRRFGVLQASFKLLKGSIESSSRTAVAHFDYTIQRDAIKRMERNFIVLESVLHDVSISSAPLSPVQKMALMESLATTRLEADVMSRSGLAMLGERLHARRSSLLSELLLLSAAAAACAISVMVLAGLMFRRTLMKLDTITEMHAANEFARLETERINGEVALLNKELSEKIQQLSLAQDAVVKKGKLEQLGRLIATVAHELRNPMGAVRTSAFLVGKKLEGKGLGIEAQLERINVGISRCDNIITQLLDYSRTKKIVPQPDDLDEWLAKLVSEEAAKLPPHVMVECTLGLGGVHVPFDSPRLRRAVLNLMVNATEALLPTSSATSLTDITPTIRISTFQRGPHAVIRVKDNGPGIATENLQRIREPLFTTKNFGTGLGIPAIEQIAEQHGGRLDIESLLGEGACFDLVLPLQVQSTPLDDAA